MPALRIMEKGIQDGAPRQRKALVQQYGTAEWDYLCI